MQDFTGHSLEVGDIVTYSENSHPALYLGRVVKLTAARVAVIRLAKGVESLAYRRPSVGRMKNPDQVTFVTDQMRDLDDVEVWQHYQRLRGL